MTLVTSTTIVVPITSSRVGKLTFRISVRTSDRNSLAFVHQFIAWASISKFYRLKRLAGQEGFEPPTFGFGDRRSTIRATALYGYLLSKRTGQNASGEEPRGPSPQRPTKPYSLRHDLGDRAGADGAAALADGEANTPLHRDRRDQLDLQVHVVPRHHHLGAVRELRHTRHVRRAEVELRTVPVEERRMTAALLLRQHVHLALELRVRLDRPRLRQHLPTLHVVLLGAAQQDNDVVAGLPLVEQLLEHLHTGDDRLRGIPDAHDLHLVAHLD